MPRIRAGLRSGMGAQQLARFVQLALARQDGGAAVLRADHHVLGVVDACPASALASGEITCGFSAICARAR
jgi:hypothetical protein